MRFGLNLKGQRREFTKTTARISFTNVKHIHDFYHYIHQHTSNENINERFI